mmetsp:Transcript_48536/g.94875  ORF Transcript_48536/g.94875 Transcript_48536/m.94875 type:complete len:267 (+) Transcript_48536:223-1023(+)
MAQRIDPAVRHFAWARLSQPDTPHWHLFISPNGGPPHTLQFDGWGRPDADAGDALEADAANDAGAIFSRDDPIRFPDDVGAGSPPLPCLWAGGTEGYDGGGTADLLLPRSLPPPPPDAEPTRSFRRLSSDAILDFACLSADPSSRLSRAHSSSVSASFISVRWDDAVCFVSSSPRRSLSAPAFFRSRSRRSCRDWFSSRISWRISSLSPISTSCSEVLSVASTRRPCTSESSLSSCLILLTFLSFSSLLCDSKVFSRSNSIITFRS